MSAHDLPVWEQPGPAEKIYAKYRGAPTLRDQWVKLLRASWGNPHFSELDFFPEVRREERTFKAADGFPVPVIVFTPPNAGADVFIYLHGGGWIAPLAGKHLAWARRIAKLSGQTVYAVEYRLAPEFPYPMALNDCLAVYQSVRAAAAGRVAIGGDSAGGNLGLAVAYYCADKKLPHPDKVLALSPVTDMFFEKYSAIEKLGVGNPLADMSLLAFERFCYLPHFPDWKNPYASPMLGDLAVLPPVFVLAGGQDPLHEENLAFEKKCRAAGVRTELCFNPDLPHAYHTQHDVIPAQADAANAVMVKFLRSVAG